MTPKKGIEHREHTVSTQRARLDLNDRLARWRERYSKRPICGRRELGGGGGGGLTPKKGIEHREHTTSASQLE